MFGTWTHSVEFWKDGVLGGWLEQHLRSTKFASTFTLLPRVVNGDRA